MSLRFLASFVVLFVLTTAAPSALATSDGATWRNGPTSEARWRLPPDDELGGIAHRSFGGDVRGAGAGACKDRAHRLPCELALSRIDPSAGHRPSRPRAITALNKSR